MERGPESLVATEGLVFTYNLQKKSVFTAHLKEKKSVLKKYVCLDHKF